MKIDSIDRFSLNLDCCTILRHHLWGAIGAAEKLKLFLTDVSEIANNERLLTRNTSIKAAASNCKKSRCVDKKGKQMTQAGFIQVIVV